MDAIEEIARSMVMTFVKHGRNTGMNVAFTFISLVRKLKFSVCFAEKGVNAIKIGRERERSAMVWLPMSFEDSYH